ncbi:hypothetical protein MA16_Dca017132 [Dendrobium catenatum]|uniref:Uncharacterized protein n=1 Tax=Dendrobium catenatum TaxID=906689 RepID=A0A2I0WAW9_9ASPA|nr:hypothetical protein MA16_Dca017132 [Dendrobium catenatum]
MISTSSWMIKSSQEERESKGERERGSCEGEFAREFTKVSPKGSKRSWVLCLLQEEAKGVEFSTCFKRKQKKLGSLTASRGSKRSWVLCLSWVGGKEGASYGFDFQPTFARIGRVENKVANRCVTHGNLPNSLGQILKKAQKRYLMSLHSISHTGTDTQPGLPQGVAVGNLGQWANV